jgi:hypothetical protein
MFAKIPDDTKFSQGPASAHGLKKSSPTQGSHNQKNRKLPSAGKGQKTKKRDKKEQQETTKDKRRDFKNSKPPHFGERKRETEGKKGARK